MCFISRDNKPKIANKDIICYKWLIKNYNGKLISPVKFFPYRLKKLYTERIIVEKHPLENHTIIINIGLHSYVKPMYIPNHYIGIIPKGSVYYTDRIDYVSEKLVILYKYNFFNNILVNLKTKFNIPFKYEGKYKT